MMNKIDYLQREVKTAVQCIIEEQEKAKGTARKTCAELLASGNSKRLRGQETGRTSCTSKKGVA